MLVEQAIDLLQVTFPGAWRLSDQVMTRTVGDVTIKVDLYRHERGVFSVFLETSKRTSCRSSSYMDEVPRIIRLLVLEVLTAEPFWS